MTDIKKKEKGQAQAKRRKLQLHKETLKDLSSGESAKKILGGGIIRRCTGGGSGCLD